MYVGIEGNSVSDGNGKTTVTTDKGDVTMDNTYSSALVELGVSLTTLAFKGTASAVNKKITAIKDEKNAEKIRNTYDEIINELLNERDEAVRIAQVYKSELDKIEISDEDIAHLQATVSSLLDILKEFLPEAPIETFQMLKNLISVDTLKTMQLLGFNYKAAIGEPLTQICADAISTWGPKGSSSQGNENS